MYKEISRNSEKLVIGGRKNALHILNTYDIK